MIWVLLMLTGISPSVIDVLREAPFVQTKVWAAKNIIMPKGSEIKGPFRLDLFPHVEEVLDCYDDPRIERITLQWGSRLGKTSSMIAILIKTGKTRPCPMAFGDADEKSVKRVLGRVWNTMEMIHCMQDDLPPRHRRNQDSVNMENWHVHGAWAGSPATAADYGAKVIFKNEASKMLSKKSREAPFYELIDERKKGFAGGKIFEGSTPTLKGKCFIERQRLAGDNRARRVPCPYCNFFQELVEGEAIYDRKGNFLGLKNGGLRWEKSASGHSDPDVALNTAWYECCACKKKIREEHRYKMLNAGLWVPEGCDVVKGKVVGKPTREGRHASFGPLSTLHSLFPDVTLGVVAKASVESRQKDLGVGDPHGKRKNFINSWMGLTWDDAPKETTPNELAMRLCVPSQTLRICPHWVRFLTRASDVQCPDNEFQFWWEVWGWGLGGRGTMIDYGVNDRQGLANEIRTRFYDHADGGPKLRPQITLIDSGNHANDMYGFCREFRGVLPCKGSSSSTFPTLFKIGGIEKSGATSDRDLQIRLGGLALLEVNHEKTNWWVENSITGLVKPDDPFGVSFPSEMAMDEDFWRQWASEYPVNGKNDNGYDIHEWKKRHRNEWRDAGRYNLVAAAYQTNYGQRFNTLPPRMTKDQIEAAALDASRRQTEQQSGLTTPDGRPFFVTNR